MTKLSSSMFFLFVTIFNYLWLRIVMFQYFYNEYGSMGLYYTVIIGIAMLLILFFTKKLLHYAYKMPLKNLILSIFTLQ